MQIIKLNATESTNTYLKNLMLSQKLEDFTVVTALEQLKGRGQKGAFWQTEPRKNLTFSVLKRIGNLNVNSQFQITICISLAIIDTLKQLNVPDLSIKWPNDILSGNSKICGILIENIVQGALIQSSILGVGLNVNQISFPNLNNASSIKLVLGKTFDLDELLQDILLNIQNRSLNLEDTMEGYEKEYETLLFRKDKPSTFKTNSDNLFMGFIRGVTKEGKLIITLEDNILKEFNLKEIQLLY